MGIKIIFVIHLCGGRVACAISRLRSAYRGRCVEVGV